MARTHSDRYVILVKDALTRVDEITPKELRDKLENENKPELLDVREQEEWEQARIIEARHLSKGVIEQEIEEVIRDQEREIILYCEDGYRSVLAADNLQKMGYHNVKSLKGGFKAWTEAGFPIKKEEA